MRSNFNNVKIVSEPAANLMDGWLCDSLFFKGKLKLTHQHLNPALPGVRGNDEHTLRSNFNNVKIVSEPAANLMDGWLCDSLFFKGKLKLTHQH